MRKILFGFILLAALQSKASAQILTNASPVKIVVPYQTTCSSVTIGTTAIDVSSNTSVASTTAGVSSIKVTNASTSATVCCSHSASVSCTAGADLYGEAIAPTATGQENYLSWDISVAQKWYCIATAAMTPIEVCRVR